MPLTLETKHALVELYKKQLQQEITDLERHIEEAKQEAIKAPGRMEARYDVRKEEETQLHDNLQTANQEKKHQLTIINGADLSKKSIIDFGTLFQTNDDKQFLILEGGGKINYQGKDIIIIATTAPIFSQIQGLATGKTFAWPNGQKNTITEII